jgi:hypothetical protein
MKIIYALIAACVSLQACNNSAPTASAGITAEEMVAMSLYEADDLPTIVATSPVEPIDGAEFTGTSRDNSQAAWTTIYVDDFGYTATVPAPAKTESAIEALGFYIDEDGGIVYAIGDTTPAIELPPLP